jgi:CheY-like chemotaxis protein
MHILVVDDAVSSRKMLMKILMRRGHTCEEARDGMEAIEKFRVSQANEIKGFDTILMDSEMPQISGPKATRVIREMGCKCMIIGITGNVMPEDVAYFEEHGADGVLAKPLDIAELERLWLEGDIYAQRTRTRVRSVSRQATIVNANELASGGSEDSGSACVTACVTANCITSDSLTNTESRDDREANRKAGASMQPPQSSGIRGRRLLSKLRNLLPSTASDFSSLRGSAKVHIKDEDVGIAELGTGVVEIYGRAHGEVEDESECNYRLPESPRGALQEQGQACLSYINRQLSNLPTGMAARAGVDADDEDCGLLAGNLDAITERWEQQQQQQQQGRLAPLSSSGSLTKRGSRSHTT